MSTTSDFSAVIAWMEANSESFDPASIATPEDTDPAGDDTDSPATKADLYQYLSYTPSKDGWIWSQRQSIYRSPGDENMDTRIGRKLLSFEWVQLMQWNNNTDAIQTYTISWTTGMKITEGSEVNASFNLGASYEGMSIGINAGVKTFKTTETTSTKTLTIGIQVPARSQLTFYQKRYYFRDKLEFVLDAWGQWWNVGPWGGYSPLTFKESRVQIDAEEYYTTATPLKSGTGSVSVNTVLFASGAGITRKRENCTERCKQTIARMGI